MSGVEPGPNGTMIRTVFVGHACAAAVTGANKSADNSNAKLFFIRLSLLTMRSSARCRRSHGLSLPAGSHDLSNHGRGARRKHGLAAIGVAVSHRAEGRDRLASRPAMASTG